MSEALQLEDALNVLVNKNLESLLKKNNEPIEQLTRPYLLNSTHSPFDTAPQLTVALQHSAHHSRPIDAPGLPLLRELIKSRKSTHASEVLVGSGLSQLIHVLLQVFAGNVVLPEGSSSFVHTHAKSLGKEVTLIPTNKATGYKLTADALERSLAKTRGIQSVLYVSNPILANGTTYSQTEIEAITEVCRRNSCYVICNATMESRSFELQDVAKFEDIYPEATITIGDLGKELSASGAQIAYALVPENLKLVFDAATLYMQATHSTTSPVSQYAFAKVLNNFTAIIPYLETVQGIYQACTYYSFKRLEKMGLNPTLPVGGISVLADFSAFKEHLLEIGITSSDQLVTFLLKNYQVALTPGEQFNIPGSDLAVTVSCTDFDGQRALESVQKVTYLDSEYVERYCSRLVRGLDALERFIDSIS